MASQLERARAFEALHVPGAPLVLFNAWDAGSAVVVANSGAKAIATGSWSVAMAHGCADGEDLPLDLALANLERIVGAVDLPVTVDLEGGYGVEPAVVAATLTRALGAGAIGCNFEDQIVGARGLHPIAVQATRIRAAREASQAHGIPAFINARTDVFLQSTAHDAALVAEAVARSRAYADAGASGFFAPGLVDERLIESLCTACPLPVNLMMSPNLPALARLAELGVARLSHGPGPYRLAMRALADAAIEAHRSP